MLYLTKLKSIIFTASVLVFFLALPTQAQDKPNIVIILADDLGNADLGYRGSEIKTPNIDKLADEGMRLESFYGMPLCTPARASLMTGRYPMRTGLQTFVIFPGHTYGLPTEETTLPQALKEADYKTVMVGKWHLGHADRKYWPQNRGFDHFYGNLVGEVDYFTKDRGGIIDWQRNGKFLEEEGYYTTQIGDEAVKLIEEKDPNKPLFLYFASLAPHSPYQAPQEYIDAYKDVFKDETKQNYAAMITELDNQVGRIVEALEKKGIRDNTLIFFASDNGGKLAGSVSAPGTGAAKTPPASNGKFRDGKASLYEGGIRVPAIMNWPGKIKPGVTNEPMHMVDVMPTILKLAGGHGDSERPFDGKDIWGSFAEGKVQRLHFAWPAAASRGEGVSQDHALLLGDEQSMDSNLGGSRHAGPSRGRDDGGGIFDRARSPPFGRGYPGDGRPDFRSARRGVFLCGGKTRGGRAVHHGDRAGSGRTGGLSGGGVCG